MLADHDPCRELSKACATRKITRLREFQSLWGLSEGISRQQTAGTAQLHYVYMPRGFLQGMEKKLYARPAQNRCRSQPSFSPGPYFLHHLEKVRPPVPLSEGQPCLSKSSWFCGNPAGRRRRHFSIQVKAIPPLTYASRRLSVGSKPRICARVPKTRGFVPRKRQGTSLWMNRTTSV